jgi:16S rRNA G966 N2-methylase RsmD
MDIKVIKSDAFNFIKNTKHKFDIIFLDPPYDFVVNEYFKIINEIFSKNLLNIEGSLIIEHSEKINISEHPNFEKSRNYGGCSFSFFYI